MQTFRLTGRGGGGGGGGWGGGARLGGALSILCSRRLLLRSEEEWETEQSSEKILAGEDLNRRWTYIACKISSFS